MTKRVCVKWQSEECAGMGSDVLQLNYSGKFNSGSVSLMGCMAFKLSGKESHNKYDITSVSRFTFKRRRMTRRSPTRGVDGCLPQRRSSNQLLTVLLVIEEVSFG